MSPYESRCFLALEKGYVTLEQLLFVVVLLATGWLFPACSRLRRVQSGCSMTVMCVDECRRV
jgi:hypothetical protein